MGDAHLAAALDELEAFGTGHAETVAMSLARALGL
jgi:ribosomal protein L11 methylase PrmA